LLANHSRQGRSVKDVFPDWFGWFFGRAKLTDPTEVNAPSGTDFSRTGLAVTIDSTLQLSAAWACIRLLSETVASLPCNVFERQGEGRRSAPSHPLYELLHNQPNADMSAFSFWQAYVAHMLTSGFGAAEKIVDGAERIIALRLLPSHRVTARRVEGGGLLYAVLEADGKIREIPENRMWITPAFSLDGRLGLSPIRFGAGVIGTALAADESAGRWFGNGMRPSGTLKTDKILTKEQREDMRKSIGETFAGSLNAGKTMVLEAGISYEAISIPPEEAQLLQTRSFGVEEVCRWFNVPPIMVGHSDKVTAWGTGIEQIVIGFATFSLRPWLMRLEQSIRRSLLQPADRARFYSEFSIEGLLRADSSGRSAFYSTMCQNGIMTRNECRRLENLPPTTGGDGLTIQSNLISIDQLGKAPDAAAQARSALMRLLDFKGGSNDDSL
jgi:HK97 family phage portal protein